MRKKVTLFGTWLTTLLLSTIISVSAVHASDMDKELRWKQQVVGDLFDGEPVTLNDGQLDFLGLLTEADPAKESAIVVLHGIGAHPDWPQVVNPLRVQLAEQGWSTLSIQLPVVDNEAAEEDYAPLDAEAAPRILAAVNYLQQAGAKDVYIVAHSLGSRMASYFLSQPDVPVKGFVGVGMNVGTVQYMSKIHIPVLDLYGSNDLEGVLGSAADRLAASAGNAAYTASVIDGADHFFNDMDDELVAAVVTWLDAN